MEIQISRLISFNMMTRRNGIKIKNEALRFYLTWIIHESSKREKPHEINTHNKKTVH
jgi:hypothetical protein